MSGHSHLVRKLKFLTVGGFYVRLYYKFLPLKNQGLFRIPLSLFPPNQLPLLAFHSSYNVSQSL